MRTWIVAAALMIIGATGPAFAFDCNATVNDDAHVISDVGKVATAAKRLGNNTGSDVKVVTYPELDGKKLGDALLDQRRTCPTWSGGGAKFRNDMIILGYSPDRHQLGVGIGINAEPKLGHNQWQEAMRQFMVPAISKTKSGDTSALTAGFVSTLDAYGGQMARPAGANGTVNIKQATDMSGLWSALKWMLVIIVLGGGAFAAYLIFGKDAKRKAAQANARRVRSICISKLNDLSDRTTLLGAKASNNAALAPLFTRYNSIVTAANRSLQSFDNMGGEDPNAARMPTEVYESNQRRYETITSSLDAAEDLARQIENGEVDTPIRREEEPAQASREAPPAAEELRGYQEPSTPSGRPSWPRQDNPSAPYIPPQEPQAYAPPQAPQAPYYPPQQNTTFQDAMLGTIIGNELSRGRDTDYRRRDDDYRRDDDLQRTVDAEDDRREDAIANARDDDDTKADSRDSGGSFFADTDSAERDTGGSFSADDSSSSSNDYSSSSDSFSSDSSSSSSDSFSSDS